MHASGQLHSKRWTVERERTDQRTINFELLQAYGGPTMYFTELDDVPEEAWRVGIVSDEMQYMRSKGARDLLIDLGLVKDAIALDSRLQRVLTNVGISLPADLATNRVKYKSHERELLQSKRLGIPS